ncbi:MAG TPA: hypothetical protein VM163_06010 [bacterium]|nr:hypothetical protein [bacterium]
MRREENHDRDEQHWLNGKLYIVATGRTGTTIARKTGLANDKYCCGVEGFVV